jgi:hypothetical protein
MTQAIWQNRNFNLICSSPANDLDFEPCRYVHGHGLDCETGELQKDQNGYFFKASCTDIATGCRSINRWSSIIFSITRAVARPVSAFRPSSSNELMSLNGAKRERAN